MPLSKVIEPRKVGMFYCLGGVHRKIWSKKDVQGELEGKGREVCEWPSP